MDEKKKTMEGNLYHNKFRKHDGTWVKTNLSLSNYIEMRLLSDEEVEELKNRERSIMRMDISNGYDQAGNIEWYTKIEGA